MDSDLTRMIDGFQALIWLMEHSPEHRTCRDCDRFGAALLRGVAPADVVGMRCVGARVAQLQVDAAIEIVKRR